MEAGPQTEAGNPYASAIAREVLFAGILNEYFPDRMKSSIVILSEVDASAANGHAVQGSRSAQLLIASEMLHLGAPPLITAAYFPFNSTCPVCPSITSVGPTGFPFTSTHDPEGSVTVAVA